MYGARYCQKCGGVLDPDETCHCEAEVEEYKQYLQERADKLQRRVQRIIKEDEQLRRIAMLCEKGA